MSRSAISDGGCGLCHRAVRLLLSEDRDGAAFRFAPLDSDAFREAVPESERGSLPDSMVLRTADGALHTRSRALIMMGLRLGGFWRLVASVVGWLPRVTLDAAYDAVARVRRRLFSPPAEPCPPVPVELRERFRC